MSYTYRRPLDVRTEIDMSSGMELDAMCTIGESGEVGTVNSNSKDLPRKVSKMPTIPDSSATARKDV